MEKDVCGSQWDMMTTMLIEGEQYMDVEAFQYHNELSTIGFIEQSPQVNKALRTWLSKLNEPRERSASLSTHYRNIGNDYHSNHADMDSLAADYFTKAIYCAPRNSIELAYAHANRAASLCRKSNFADEGFWDCELAIKFNYPKDKLCKLLQRKLMLGYVSNRIDRIAETLKQLEELVVTQKIASTRNLNLNNEKQKFEEYKRQKGSEEPTMSETLQTETAQKKLIEKSLPECGRFIVAGEGIKAGEQIYREKAFAFVPVYNDYRKLAISHHCQNCAKTNCIPFPCHECCRASYCSPECCLQHVDIHKYECDAYREKNLWIKIGIAHLAMRNLLVGFPSLLEKTKHLRAASLSSLWDAILSINDPDFAYGEALSLVTNFDKMNRLDCLRYVLTAQMLSIYLAEHTSFAEQWNSAEYSSILRNKDEWHKLVASLLMRHMGQLVCNGHAISDMEVLQPSDYGYMRDKDRIMVGHLYQNLASTRVFTAIFPKISLFNHSCDPNIRNSFDGQFLTVYAARPIDHGEQVFNCYGPHYKLMDREERQSALAQQYCFECKCEKCTSNDSTFDQYYRYQCPNDGCGSAIDLNGIVANRWWHDIDDNRLCDAIAPKFACGKCNRKLFLNPTSLVAFSGQAMQQEADGRRSPNVTKDILNYYFAVGKCLSKHHELKHWMAQQIFADKISDDENFMSLAYVVVDNFIAARERYGIHSMEFAMATTYALRVVDVIHADDNGRSDRSEKQKILKILNLKQIAKALSILPKSTQNYYTSSASLKKIIDEKN